jgi:hypothetical protein
MPLCYKDKTFCSSDCVVSDCWRFLSDEDREGARKWWPHDPDNAPIALSDFSKDCFWYKPSKREGEYQ